MPPETTASIRITPIAGSLGAEITGLDLAKPCSEQDFETLRDAVFTHGAIYLRNQTLSHQAHLEFGRRFGKLDVHPIANGMAEYPEIIRVHKPAGEEAFFGTSWHSDNSFFERPSGIVVLYGERVPPYGGDTVFASMEQAYERLSEGLKTFLDPLVAVHSASRAYDPRTTGDAKYKGEAAITYTYSDSIHDEVEHPVVRTHPETGRKSLYVNPMFTLRIVGLHPNESEAILNMLHAHSTRPDFTCRFSWEPGTVVIWDNRIVQHYAIDDYREFDRVLYRVSVSGELPR